MPAQPTRLTKAAVLKFGSHLDHVASVIQGNYAALGIPDHIARDFAFRCDALSDHIERKVGVDRMAASRKAELDPKQNFTETKLVAPEFDPAEIGEETNAPLLVNSDEPYMGTFRQEWFDQLREVQQTGQFSNAKAAAELVKKMAQLLEAHEIPLHVAQRAAAQ
jgi:hypothetical protein